MFCDETRLNVNLSDHTLQRLRLQLGQATVDEAVQ